MIDVWVGPPVPLRFERDDERASVAHPADIQRRWRALCARNPHLFDAPICAVTAFDPDDGVLRWRPSCYRDLAVQPEVNTDTWQLSTTALLCAHDRVLLARRSERVHTYPGLYELGPSGGIEPPETNLDESLVIENARREIREEIGLDFTDAARIVGVFRDSHVRSYDILVACMLHAEAAPKTHNWEYEDLIWAPVTDPWRVLDPERVCPPSRAVLGCLGRLLGRV